MRPGLTNSCLPVAVEGWAIGQIFHILPWRYLPRLFLIAVPASRFAEPGRAVACDAPKIQMARQHEQAMVDA